MIIYDNIYDNMILVQVTTYRRLGIGRDGHLDQSQAYRYIVTCTRIRALHRTECSLKITLIDACMFNLAHLKTAMEQLLTP